MDDALKRLILKTYDAHRIRAEALSSGMVTLRGDGTQKVLEGVSTIEELIRVTQS
jgi:type II secretory ATPase GspE/PulE/Tfp pilus assembly ATPase PilB-like protein